MAMHTTLHRPVYFVPRTAHAHVSVRPGAIRRARLSALNRTAIMVSFGTLQLATVLVFSLLLLLGPASPLR